MQTYILIQKPTYQRLNKQQAQGRASVSVLRTRKGRWLRSTTSTSSVSSSEPQRSAWRPSALCPQHHSAVNYLTHDCVSCL